MSTASRLLKGANDRAASVSERLPDSITQWLFIIPAFVFYIPFLALPAIFIFVLSFFEWDGVGSLTFVGLANFTSALSNPVMYTALWNNFEVAILSVILQVILGLGIALAIRAAHTKLREFYQGALLLPMTLMSVGVSLVWAYMYNPAYGIINSALNALGVERTPLWLGDPQWALLAIVLVATWQWMGFRIVLWLTGLENIDKRYYEAATIDGANRLQTFWYVTLPQLKPVAVFIMVYTIVGSFRSFAYFWVLTRGGPGHATEVMVTWIYKNAFFQSNYGDAAALSVILFLVTLVLSLISFVWGEQGGASA